MQKSKGQGQMKNINRLAVPRSREHLIISYCSCTSRLFHMLNIDLFPIKFTGTTKMCSLLCMMPYFFLLDQSQ